MTRPRLSLILALVAACSSSTTTTPPAGGTGAFGIVVVNGKQKLYLPRKTTNALGNGQIAVVDVGLAGNGVQGAPALITTIDLGSTDLATTTAGDSSVVLAASTSSFNVWFIDPSSDTITKTLTLDSSYGRSSFSGGSGIVTGIAMDETNHRAILSIWDGFAIVDLSSKTVTQTIVAAPSENFGFDEVRQLIVAPFYDCQASIGGDSGTAPPVCLTYVTSPDGGSNITDGLNLIKTDGGVYTYNNPDASDPTAPLGTEPDSAAVDVSTGLAIVPSEGGGFQNILDLTKVVFNDSAHTFSLPVTVVPDLSYTGVAIEQVSHLVFLEEEFGESIAAFNLVKIVADAGMVVQAEMPDLPDGGGYWSNLGDPHGVAVAAGISNNKPYGYVVTDQGGDPLNDVAWVARVDLNVMLGLSDGGFSLTSDQVAPAVTLLNATVKE